MKWNLYEVSLRTSLQTALVRLSAAARHKTRVNGCIRGTGNEGQHGWLITLGTYAGLSTRTRRVLAAPTDTIK